MRSFTFSLTSLLAIITLLSLDFGAIVADARIATSAAYTVFLGLLCFGVAASLIAPADRRPFWIGFATFGLVYWVAVFETPGSNSRSAYGGWALYGLGVPEPQGSNFIASDLLEMIESRLVARRAVGSHVFCRWQGGGYYWGNVLEIDDDGRYLIKWDDGSVPTWQTRADMASTSAHRRVALHCTVGTLWALLGGAVVAYWVGRVTKKAAGETTTSTSAGPGSDS